MNLIILVSVAFFTLIERKILGRIQTRKGPNKISFQGVLQPISDAFKLFFKESNFNYSINKIIFQQAPSLILIITLIIWLTFSFSFIEIFKFRIIYIILISRLSVYGILLSGWSSNSKYSLLGAYRRIAQVISYEVGIIFLIITFFISSKNFNIINLTIKNIESHLTVFGIIFIFIIWIIVILAELNRAPFDFAERESELVSGFNIEYGSLKFALIFIAEYGNMLFISYITIILFFYTNYFFILTIIIIIVIVRGAYPRHRYDILIRLNWKQILPFLLIFFFNWTILVYNL